MKVTTFQGVVEDGRIRLSADVRLPEKATGYPVGAYPSMGSVLS